ncbi:hypothetical protein VTH06DRAFT_1145 [Thermothelomyces fergusii]
MIVTRPGGVDPAPANAAGASSSSNARHPSNPHDGQTRRGHNISGSDNQASSHVHYAADTAPSGSAADPTDFISTSFGTEAATNPGVPRRLSRIGTFRTVDDFEEFAVGPGWYPGAEPGVDPSKPDGGHASMPTLSAPCAITVVDFSQERLSMQRHDNGTLPTFLSQSQPEWVKCRWINVNGLSWDVIKALGRYKNLHRLAIEDITITRNRTKAEWFPTHAFIVLTLQKLVHLYGPESDGSDPELEEDPGSRENDIERPIIRRLQTDDTIIRQSCDASMVGQAIMDEIIDLAIPVAACYGDVISDLELDVLTRPNIGHTKSLYILVSEINKILSFINPITTLINALRDHQANLAPDAIMSHLLDPNHGVIITPMTNTYLGDVLDHCLLITETLNQLKGLADGMIGLIFNTISANQNESMKQLTIATIIFLPLTFLTGYFGQNFQPFSVLEEDIGYFWKIAIPVVAVTTIALLWEGIYEYCRALLQRRDILRLRRSRRRRRN